MIDIDAIGVRCRAATAGPWLVDSDQRPGGAAQVVEAADTTCAVCFMTSDRFECRDDADAQFIAAARTDVPAMAQALREARDYIGSMAGMDSDDYTPDWVARDAKDWLARWFGE